MPESEKFKEYSEDYQLTEWRKELLFSIQPIFSS